MDEPERVFELAIDGVEVTDHMPPATTRESKLGDDWDFGTEELSKRMSEKINKRVHEALERSLGKLGEKD